MATCSTAVCGTGGWTGPLPGDPDNSVTLSAAQAFGGINVRWSYPTTNPHAVAYIELYRGSTPLFASATRIALVGGNLYFDAQNNTNTWYYWIRIVSINGTLGEPVGPASATARLLSTDISQNLNDEIDRSKLTAALKAELDVIPFLQSSLLSEIYDRETGQTSLADAIADAQAGIAAAMTFIGTVNTSRITDNEALAQSLTVTAAVLQNGIAAVTDEMEAHVVALGDDISAEVLAREQAVVFVDNKYAGITSAQAASISTVNGRVTTEISDRQQAVTNVGNRVTGVETTVSVHASEITNIYSSMWTVRLQAGNLVGGFGLYNNSTVVEAAFDVDRFWIGRSGSGSSRPFIIDGGVVYIDKAKIKEADIDTLKIAGGAVNTLVASTGSGTTGSIASAAITVPAGASGVLVVGKITSMMTITESFGGSASATIWRGGSPIDTVPINTGGATNSPFIYVDNSPGTGSVTYSITVTVSGASPIDYTISSSASLALLGAKR